MSLVSSRKAYYSTWRARGEKTASATLRDIAQFPIQVIDVDMELARLAAGLKAEHIPPNADFSAGALARARKATLVTSDKDFGRLGGSVRTA